MTQTTKSKLGAHSNKEATPENRSSNQDRRAEINSTRRTILKAIPAAGVAVVGIQTAAAQSTFPETIPLPTGFQPEGIAIGRGHEFFVGSLAGGAIYRGDLRTGEGEVLVPPTEDGVAVGLSYDSRSNHLFVAGQSTGKGSVYDAKTGEAAADYSLTEPGSFVNDVVVTSDAAYFTDSFRPFLYKVPLCPGGQLPEQSEVEEISLGDTFTSVEEEFNTNGIDAPPSGDYLIIVNSTTGLLYKVDPATGDATEVDLGEQTLTAGDGLLLDGKTLYVVRNQQNLIAVVQLESGAAQGEVVREITDEDFDVPTTIAEFGNALYAVNARFGISDPGNAEYNVIRVPK